MKLLTHNLLSSHVRGLRPGGGFPLRIQASEVRVRPVPFNAAFVARLVPRLRWAALLQAAESLGHPSELPPEPAPRLRGGRALPAAGAPRPAGGGGAGGGPAVPGFGAPVPHFPGDPQHAAERGGGLRGGRGAGDPPVPPIYWGGPPQKNGRVPKAWRRHYCPPRGGGYPE